MQCASEELELAEEEVRKGGRGGGEKGEERVVVKEWYCSFAL